MGRLTSLGTLLLILVVAAPGCVVDRTGTSGSYLLRSKLDVTRERTRDLETDLAAERGRVDAIEARAAEARRRYADSGATVGALMEDLTYLRGQLSDVQHQLQENGQLTSDMEFQLLTMEVRLGHIEGQLVEKVPDYEMAPLMFEDPEPEPTSEPDGEGDAPEGDDVIVPSSADSGAADADDAPGLAALEEPTAEEVSDEEAMFRSALDLVQKGSYRKAGGRLDGFLEAYPTSDWWLEAQFLVGQCMFEMERYKGAITEFQKVIIRDERSDWAARSMYMQAVSFEELGTEEDKDAARVFYSEVVSLYPGSEHATQAKERLDALDR
jgi:tol-pal system protein YbgF